MTDADKFELQWEEVKSKDVKKAKKAKKENYLMKNLKKLKKQFIR